MFAAANNQASSVALLLELGSDPEVRDGRNWRAQEHAEGDVEVLAALARHEGHNIGTGRQKQ
jgi:hypothetical protein